MVWVVSRFRLKAPPGISSSCISPLTSSRQRSRAPWAYPTSEVGYTIATTRRETMKVHKNIWWHWGGGKLCQLFGVKKCKVTEIKPARQSSQNLSNIKFHANNFNSFRTAKCIHAARQTHFSRSSAEMCRRLTRRNVSLLLLLLLYN